MKKVVYVILSVVVLYFILCLVGPADARVERSTSISAPAESVKPALTDNKIFFDKWSPWTEKDPNMQVTYEGTAGEPGQKMAWNSQDKKVGKGSMTIERITADSVVQKLAFDGRGESTVYFTWKGETANTNVTWGMYTHIPFMMRGMMLFMNMDKMVGPDFEKGLVKLKTYVESTPAPSTAAATTYEVKEVTTEERVMIGAKKSEVTFDKIASYFGETYQKLQAEFKKENITMTGPPCGLYWIYDETKGTTTLAATLPVAKDAKLKSKAWERYDIPPSKALLVEYHGDYMNMMGAHNAIKNYMKEKNLSEMMVMEEYVTDPGTEKDSSKWLTNIYYILK